MSEIDEAMGIVQHHDAVSGTERQAVTEDYALRLSDGITAATVSFPTLKVAILCTDSTSSLLRMSSIRRITSFYQTTVIHHHLHHSFFVNS
jgi:Alpha mannosidase middle domain